MSLLLSGNKDMGFFQPYRLIFFGAPVNSCVYNVGL